MDPDDVARIRTFPKNGRLADVPCPSCRKRQSKVLDTRGIVAGGIRRRRECVCGNRFTTYEQLERDPRSLSSTLSRLELIIEGLRDSLASVKQR